MAPSITVFADPRKIVRTTQVATVLRKYYEFYVDGKDYLPNDIKVKYKNANARFFCEEDGEWLMYKIDAVEELPPSFVVTFDKDSKIPKDQWMNILKWVRTIFKGEDDYELNELVYSMIPKPKVLDEKIVLSKSIEPKSVPDQKEYLFRMKEDEGLNIALFEIIKPYTDKPYTCVIRDYKNRGEEPFYTALYVCTSWGVCSKDHEFLSHLWNHRMKGMGPLDLENRLKKAIENCTPREGFIPDSEPEVYRLTIEEVYEKWLGKRKYVEEEE